MGMGEVGRLRVTGQLVEIEAALAVVVRGRRKTGTHRILEERESLGKELECMRGEGVHVLTVFMHSIKVKPPQVDFTFLIPMENL